MFVRKFNIFSALKTESVFRNDIDILAPMPAVLFRYNCSRNICQTLKFHPLVRAHSTFFKGFSSCRFKWRFVILTAPGNKLPLVVICTMERTPSIVEINGCFINECRADVKENPLGHVKSPLLVLVHVPAHLQSAVSALQVFLHSQRSVYPPYISADFCEPITHIALHLHWGKDRFPMPILRRWSLQ